jgi:Ca2+-binding EF-hand superfamily protein
MEYVSLPGVLSDRLYAVLSADSSDGRVNPEKFYKILSTIYCSDLIQKMGLVFSLYDFDNDGYIQREDVKILLSYIPLRNQSHNQSSNNLCASSTSLSLEEEDGLKKVKSSETKNINHSPREGLYSHEDGKDMGIKDRAEI